MKTPAWNGMMLIGIDVGGTTTRVGAVRDDGQILACRKIPTPTDASANTLLDCIVRDARDLQAQLGANAGPVQAVGLALPGLFDRQRSRLTRCVNLPRIEGVPLGASLGQRLRLPTVCVTDAEAATWAEYQACPSTPKRFLHLRLGTGVACGLVKEGELQDLGEGRSMHLDELVVEHGTGAMACRCGRRGCLETLASGAALAARVVESGFGTGPAGLQSACRRGDAHAHAIVAQAGRAVQAAGRNLLRSFGVDLVSLGGGVIHACPALFAAVADSDVAAVSPGPPDEEPPTPRFTRALLHDDAGVIGAALLASQRVQG